MGRPIAVVVAFTLLASATQAGAAEVTRVASSGEPNNPFDLDLSIRWERLQRRGSISREFAGAPSTGPFATLIDADQLRLSDVRNTIVPRMAVGLYEDLELHVEVPYVLADENNWRYASAVTAGDSVDTIGGNTIAPDGSFCTTTPCPIFQVPSTVFTGGVAGDVKAGLAWGIFSDKRDDTKPFWLVGFDVTFPSAKRYDPAVGRNRNTWLSPFSLASQVGPIGEKVWKYDLQTALSRRLGPIDPYFKAHVTGMHKSSSTYSNCEHMADLVAADQAPGSAVAACASAQWKDKAGARLPWLMGLTVGTELVPYEDTVAGQKITIDLRVVADYTSSARWFNELTDATGKLLATDPYVTVTGQVGLIFRASEYVSLQTIASLGTQSPHFVTGESPGTDASGINTAAQNPNFDWRYDAPGRRFRVSGVSLFDLMVSGVLQF